MINNFLDIIDKNSVTLSELNNLDQDMRCLLNKNESIVYDKCNDININIDSKINHITFINCKNITLNIFSLVSGIEVRNCENINLFIKKIYISNSITITRSSAININITVEDNKKNIYNIEKSKLIHIKDYNGKTIKYIKKK